MAVLYSWMSLMKHCLKVGHGKKVSSISKMRSLWCLNYFLSKRLKMIEDPPKNSSSTVNFEVGTLNTRIYRKVRERNIETLRTSPTKGAFYLIVLVGFPPLGSVVPVSNHSFLSLGTFS